MKRRHLVILAVLLMILALSLILYPLISQKYWDSHAAKIYAEYMEEIDHSNEQLRQELLLKAQKYNDFMRTGTQFADMDKMELQYAGQLDMGNGIMGWIEIPKIGVKQPMLHGTSAQTLERGVGHLLGSSLPIGGIGSHCVLTGHSGMAGQKMFSDLPQLQIGDIFYLTVLGERLIYQVTDINTILPEDVSLLAIQPDSDLCTLITCVPFGVNTHRLLITGTRVTEEKQIADVLTENSDKTVTSTWEENYKSNLILGGMVGTSVFASALIIGKIAERRSHRDNIM